MWSRRNVVLAAPAAIAGGAMPGRNATAAPETVDQAMGVCVR